MWLMGLLFFGIIDVCRPLTILQLRLANYEVNCQFDILNLRLKTKFALYSGA